MLYAAHMFHQNTWPSGFQLVLRFSATFTTRSKPTQRNAPASNANSVHSSASTCPLSTQPSPTHPHPHHTYLYLTAPPSTSGDLAAKKQASSHLQALPDYYYYYYPYCAASTPTVQRFHSPKPLSRISHSARLYSNPAEHLENNSSTLRSSATTPQEDAPTWKLEIGRAHV